VSVVDPRLEHIRILQQTYSAQQHDRPLLLEERINLLHAVIANQPAIGPELGVPLGQYLHDFGGALYEHFLHIQEIKHLVEAERNLRLAIAASSAPNLSSVLGSVLREHACEIRDSSLSEEALALHRRGSHASRAASRILRGPRRVRYSRG
jgi:hypothetical protein